MTKVVSDTNTSWQESLPIISDALISDNYSLVCTFTSRTLGVGAGSASTKENDETTPLPNNVRKTLQRIHCRALIHLSKYVQVLDYCVALPNNDQQERSVLALEEAYAIYKLGRYLKCRDFILKKQKQQQQDMTIDCEEGLMHILAQCYYRLHETSEASRIYTELLRRQGSAKNKICTSSDNETMTNALAVHVANFSPPTSFSSILQSSAKPTTEVDDFGPIVETALLRKGQDYPYELAYNYATYLLLTSSSLSQVKKAMELLINAERESQNDGGDVEANGEDDDDDERQQREDEIQRNVMPIQANLALGKLLCSDWNGATRAYLQLVLSAKQQQQGIGIMSNGGGGPIMVAENNLAMLYSKRGTSCSVFDLLKKVPNVAYGANDSTGISKTTPNQVRMLLYNRALLFYKMNKFTDSKNVLDHLTKALSTDGQQQYQQQKVNAKKKKGKKNKGVDRSRENGDISKDAGLKQQQTSSSSNGTAPLPAPPANDADLILWQCRIALLESEIVRRSQEVGANSDDADTIIRKITEKVATSIKTVSGSNGSIHQKATLEYALAELTLHNLGKMTTDSAVTIAGDTGDGISEEVQKKMISVLDTLPTSIRSRPATIATLSALYGNLGMDDKVANILDSTSGSGMAQKSLADFKLRLGSYEEAVSLYESTVLAVEEGKMSLSKSDVLECKAGMVKALSYYDIQKAIELASTLPLKVGTSVGRDNENELDGEELEAMDIPRLSKSSGIIGSGGRSSRMQKILGSRRGINDSQKKKKKNQDAILRQRTKKRELYLEKLQKEGRYNPDRPAKPDPERWIPKNQRSYAKRGRKARQKFVGAQGGGTGAGAEKDAARLDAMVRAAARAEGKDAFTQQPSTAHLSVASTNGYGGKSTRRR